MSAATSVPDPRPSRPSPAAWDSAMLEPLPPRSPVAFTFIDTDLRLRRVSRSLAEMIGTTPAEQVGHTPAEVWPPALAASAESAVRKVLADGMPVSDGLPGGVGHGPQADAGQDGQTELSWFPARRPDGTVTGGTMIARHLSGESA